MRKEHLIRRIIFLFAFFMYCNFSFGQGITVTGTVKDNTGTPIPGVTILIKGTSKGTTTNIDGKYSIQTESNSTLVFSFIGYATEEIAVNDRAVIDLELKAATESLDEVVVIGYGTTKKTDLTGSVTAVSSKDFNKGAITSPQELLVGKSAGVVISTSGGAPGTGATIRIRGGSSLRASNDPLLIIDGVPIDNNNVSGSSNLLSFINPNDVESVTVLKDASSTAIYGSRASNGVIIITTKKGKTGTPFKISYDGSTSIASAIKFVDVYSGDEIRQIAYNHPELYDADSYDILWNGNTNWQKQIFRTAVSHDHNMTLTGAYNELPYRASIGYTDQNGILKNTDMQRITGSISVDPKFLKNTLKVSVNAKGMYTKNNFGDDGAIGSAINMDPTKPIRDGNRASNGYFQWVNYDASLGTANPVEQLMESDNHSKVKRFIGNIQLNYQLPYIQGLNANLNLATDYYESEGHNNRSYMSPSVLTNPYWGKINTYSAHNYNNLLDFYLNYNKDLSQIYSKVEATAGYSWQHFERKSKSYTTGYHYYGDPVQIDRTSPITENYLVSFFGRINYTFKEKYLLTFTIRDDGSSRFSKDNRWGLFPSAAFAWKIKDESFLKGVSAISNLKLRLGWGVTGQQDINSGDYPYQAQYITSATGNYYIIDGDYIPTLRPNPYDPNIKWEETTTQNIGLDFGLFNERITGSVEFYKRVTDDLINEVTIPTGSNFKNTLVTNVGSLENKGVELSLNLVPISKKDMSLNIGFNLTYNKNEVTKLLMSDDPNFIGILYGDAFTGQKQVTRVGYPAYSFFVNKQVYNSNGDPIEGLYVDLSGNGGTVNGDNSDKYIYHNPSPDYLLGFSARFSYKKFDFSASSRASIGNYVYNQVAAGSSYDQMYQIGYWKNFPKYLDDTKFVKRQFTSDYFVENASFFKLDNISAGYLFENVYGKFNVRLSFTVQNVLTITKYSGIDPEVPNGIDNNFYPRPRTYMLGLSINY